MDNRAYAEIRRASKGFDLKSVHGQALEEYEEFERLIHGALLFLNKIGHPIGGVGIDMGSGTGVGACILSKLDFMETIYAVEMSEQFVRQIMPIVFQEFDADAAKIQRVVGDFNNLELGEGTIGLIVDLDSFHHSEDLDLTLRECWRVMIPGGVIIAIDRAWPDCYSQEQLEAKLDVEINDDLKRKYGIAPDASFTRREFGEHEYTISQWLDAFARNGFDVTVFHKVRPRGLNRLWHRIPTDIRRSIEGSAMFTATILVGAFAHRLGLRRHRMFGFFNTRTLFIGIKE